MVKIKFTKSGANSVFGSFSSGDRREFAEAMARHLVEVGVAVYVDEAPEAEKKPAKKAKGK